MPDLKIIDVTMDNIDENPPACFLNPTNEGYRIKRAWLQNRFSEGLKIKLLTVATEKKPVGFIEYVPGEYAWRAVDAAGYLFIHCIWVSPNKYKEQGYGSLLVQECIKEAEKAGKYGVAVVTSDGPFMAGKALFLKNGFESVAQAKPSFNLMVKPLKEGPLPQFRDWEKQLTNYKGLHAIYANQCPWVARSIQDLKEIAAKNGLKLQVTELNTAHDAQNAPSLYAVFSLIYNGKLIVDHYISTTRFQNIIKKELR